jgi:hypothetical protein
VLLRILLQSRAQHGEQHQAAAHQQQQGRTRAAYRSSNRVAVCQQVLRQVVVLAACPPAEVAVAARAQLEVAPCPVPLAASWQQRLLLLLLLPARTVVPQSLLATGEASWPRQGRACQGRA